MGARAIERCRVCGATALTRVLDLGVQALTGMFPRSAGATITEGPLVLVKCEGPCGLVQLAHDYDGAEMYGMGYGYRSGLNRSMVKHLTEKVAWLQTLRPLRGGDVVLDIGSNDGTTLSQYPKEPSITLVGIDPTAAKFRQYYPAHVQVVPEFFDASMFERVAAGKRARIVTSIAMFYDLPAPMDFVRDVAKVLADDGIWHFEQSYLPTMLEMNSYDTVCHEHLEYYGLRQIQWMMREAGLRIVDVRLNDVNGGSFAVTVEKGTAEDAPVVAEMLAKEEALGLHTLAPYQAFAKRTAEQREALRALLADLKAEGRRVLGLGASTKGNVVLQYCGIGPDALPSIAEVNPDKYGCFTPGTKIPIVSEDEARASKPDVFLVLPWHFRATFMEREKAFLAGGGKLLFPLPFPELVGA